MKISYRKSLEEIRKDLKTLNEFWVVIYGSWAKGETTSRSDIDVAVITRTEDTGANIKIRRKLLGKTPPLYDVKVFELFPLHIKASVMAKYTVVFGDPLEISEYFYYYRKLWKDVEKRYLENQFTSYKEILEGIERRKKLRAQLAK